MPDALAEELIKIRNDARNTKRQLGELDRVNGVQVKKSGVIKCIVKQYDIKTRNVSGDTMIWGNPTQGIWGTNKWNVNFDAAFILGHTKAAILGTSKLGLQSIPDWVTWYDSGDLE